MTEYHFFITNLVHWQGYPRRRLTEDKVIYPTLLNWCQVVNIMIIRILYQSSPSAEDAWYHFSINSSKVLIVVPRCTSWKAPLLPARWPSTCGCTISSRKLTLNNLTVSFIPLNQVFRDVEIAGDVIISFISVSCNLHRTLAPLPKNSDKLSPHSLPPTFEVIHIVNCKIDPSGKQFLVRWKGYNSLEDI